MSPLRLSLVLLISLLTPVALAAHAIAGLTRPTGLATKGSDFYVVDDAGQLTVVARP